MLLKISLGLAILVGIATLVMTGGVKERIDGLTTQVADATTAKDAALDAQRRAQAESRTNKMALENLSKEHMSVTNMLAAVSARLSEQERRANTASRELVSVTEERNEAQRELNKWTGLGLPPERVREEIVAKRQLEAERVALNTDIKTFSRKNTELLTRLRRYEDPDAEVPLPAGTKGRVVAVDPKYDFIVLDIGGNQGLVPDAKMMVNRDGKLVAKVIITRVEPNRAVANIIPEWKQDDIMEGDQVVY